MKCGENKLTCVLQKLWNQKKYSKSYLSQSDGHTCNSAPGRSSSAWNTWNPFLKTKPAIGLKIITWLKLTMGCNYMLLCSKPVHLSHDVWIPLPWKNFHSVLDTHKPKALLVWVLTCIPLSLYCHYTTVQSFCSEWTQLGFKNSQLQIYHAVLDLLLQQGRA